MITVYLGLGIFAIGIIIFALALLYQGDGSSGQKLMQYFLMATLVQNAGYLLELTSSGSCHCSSQGAVYRGGGSSHQLLLFYVWLLL